MATASLSGLFTIQAFTDAGTVAANYRLYTYQAGTTTHKAAFTDTAGVTAHTYVSDGLGGQYIALNARGELPAPLFLTLGAYDIRLNRTDGTTVWTRRAESADDAAETLRSELASSADLLQGAGQIGYSRSLAYGAGTVGAKLRESLSVKDDPYNAVGNGVADDTSAIVAAEAAAFSAGVWLHFPPGEYLTNAGLTFRVPVIGYGATLRCTASSESLTGAVMWFDGITRPQVHGLTINCNNTRRGLLFTGCTSPRAQHVRVVNALFGGLAAYDSTDVNVTHCEVDGAIYPTPSAAHAADAFYIESCVGARVAYCTAKNFERIGFVTEGDADKSDQVLYVGCHAENARNCDDSATEFNAAFWHENTNNITYIGCTGKNISSGTGQTSGRVRGFVSAVGSSVRCKVNYVGCSVYGNTTDIPIGYYAQGSSQLPSVNYEGCYVSGCKNGLYTLGGIDTLSIEQFDVEDITSAAGEGAITLDISSGALNELHIDGLRVTNKTYNADAADIDFFSAHASTVYSLRNAYGVSHIMRQGVARATIESASVDFGSGSYAGFSAARLVFGSGAQLTPRSGAVEKRLFQDFQMENGIVEFQGSRLSSASTFEMTYGAASVNILASGAVFDGLTININMTGSFTHQFTGCRIVNVPATTGFYRANSASATKHVLIMTGCYFSATSTGNTPLRKNTNNPTNTVLQSNTYNTTSLHTFDGGVTQANNTAV